MLQVDSRQWDPPSSMEIPLPRNMSENGKILNTANYRSHDKTPSSLHAKPPQSSLLAASENSIATTSKIKSDNIIEFEEFHNTVNDNITKRHGKRSSNTNAIIEKFNKISNERAININSLVRPTDASLMQYNEARTPIVLEKYKLVLITNPKSGSTVLKQLMRRMMGHEDDFSVHEWGANGLPHKHPANGLNYTAHYSLDEVDEMMTSDEWTRATFVRDPKGRALSSYLMLRPRVGARELKRVVRMAKRGAFTNETALREMLHDRDDVGPMQVANCCLKRNDVDANWKVLCLDHVLAFEGFLDAIDNPRSKFSTAEAVAGSKKLSLGDVVFSPEALRDSPGCWDAHWAPLSHWRLEPKFYATLNFVGHLETARRDVRRLLDDLGSDAWEKFGASGWGEYGNESMFESSSTVNHASEKASARLREYYTSKDIEERVDKIYEDDYENEYLNLSRVPIGEVESFYKW